MQQSLSKKSSLELSIEIWEGNDAISMIDNHDFRVQWEFLLQECGYGSVFQGPNFVIPWYKLNIQEFSPIVLATFSESRLVGLLTLARKLNSTDRDQSRRLVGAGNFYALYQSWIVENPYLAEFWNRGIKNLLKKYPACVINLKSVPNPEIYKDLLTLSDFRSSVVLERFHNPILDFSEEGYDKIFAKRHFKSKINRLNKAGKVQFEKIVSLEKLKEIFPTIATFYALRQGAAFNKIPYLSHEQEMDLFAAWLKEGILHMTCMWFDGSLIGAIAMINDFGKTGHLAGLITYSPSHARFSPGLVQLYYHATLLKQEHFENLKLSPGYDAYKDRFSNKHEEIHELMISRDVFQLAKRRIRIKFRKVLLKNRIRPMELEVIFSKWKSKLKKWPSTCWFRLTSRKISMDEIVVEIKKLQKSEATFSIILDQDNLDHLLLADDSTFEVSRWEFLEDALERLEKNERFLCCINGTQLVLCVWYNGEAVDDLDRFMDAGNQVVITKIFNSQNLK